MGVTEGKETRGWYEVAVGAVGEERAWTVIVAEVEVVVEAEAAEVAEMKATLSSLSSSNITSTEALLCVHGVIERRAVFEVSGTSTVVIEDDAETDAGVR